MGKQFICKGKETLKVGRVGSDDHQEVTLCGQLEPNPAACRLAASAENLVDLPPGGRGPWGSQHLLLLVVSCPQVVFISLYFRGSTRAGKRALKLQREPTGEKCGCRVGDQGPVH